MKTGKIGLTKLIAVFALVTVAMPISSFAAEQNLEFNPEAMNGNTVANHVELATHYEKHADELYAKIEEQIEALSHKPKSSFFGKNGQHIKKHVEYKIHEFEKEAEDSLKKAAYHKRIAEEQSIRPTFAASGKTKG